MFAIAAASPLFIREFGGRFPYYWELLARTGLPEWVVGFANFDGVHYLNIAEKGYSDQFTQAFFPLYPLIVKFFTLNNYYFLTALILSNIFFLAALYLLYQLFKLDYNKDTSYRSITLLLIFPTAFYFGAVYSESLFLLLTVLTLILARRNNLLLAGIFAGLASATRIFGIFLTLALALELYTLVKAKKIKVWSKQFFLSLMGLVLAPSGLILYMVYLKIVFNNPFYFLSAQPIFGAERSAETIILLPQVIFRYLKMMLSVPINTLPFFNVILEFSLTMFFLGLLILSFKKIRLSYWVFSLGCLLLPTLTGTLSSMPRYVLMGFLLFPVLVERAGKYFKPLAVLLVFVEMILAILFIRGYWVA